MVSKHTFLGVATATKTTAVVARATTLAKAVAGVATKFAAMAKFTDFATNVATLAKFATAKAVAIKSVKLATMAVLATFATATLTGCDEAKSLFSSIEEPLVGVEMDNKFNLVLFIQSQDNETSINSVKLNRGNCGVAIYETSERTLLNYARANRDRVVVFGKDTAEINFVLNGQVVTMDGMATLKFGKNGLEFNRGKTKFQVFSNDLSPYQSLDEASRSAFGLIYPVKLPYGEKFIPKINCEADKIIEVELVTNGGTFTYNLEQGGIR